MKASNTRQFSSIAARTLKVVGIILILSTILNFIILAIPGNTADIAKRSWQLVFTTQVVDRGVFPLMGIAFFSAGSWIEAASGMNQERRLWLDLQFWTVLLASLLGLIYLLLVPLHLNNTRLELKDALTQINQKATQLEGQLDAELKSKPVQEQIEQRKSQLRSQITALLQDEEKLRQTLDNKDTPQELKKLLQEAKNQPKVLDQFLDRQAQAMSSEAVTRIRTEKQDREKEVRIRSRNSSLQTGIGSLLLAIGYITVGWTGLKSLGVFRFGHRKV